MLNSECLECRRIYKKVNDGKRKVDFTHGLCPECFEKVRNFNKNLREQRRKNKK